MNRFQKTIFITAILLLTFAFNFSGISTFAAEKGLMVNIKCKETHFKELVKTIYEQTGYKVEASDNLLNEAISGDFSNTDLFDFIKRAFSQKSIFIINDTDNHILRIGDLRENKNYVAIDAESGNTMTVLDQNELEERDIQEIIASRDEVEKMIETGEHVVGLSENLTLNEMIDSRDEVEQLIESGELVVEIAPGLPLSGLLEDRDEVEKSISEKAN